MSVEKTVEAVLGTGPVMTIGGIDFQAHKLKLGEKYLFGPLADLEVKAAKGDSKAQKQYAERVAAILTKRCDRKITADWVSEQEDAAVTNLLLVIAGVRRPPAASAEGGADAVEEGDEGNAGRK